MASSGYGLFTESGDAEKPQKQYFMKFGSGAFSGNRDVVAALKHIKW